MPVYCGHVYCLYLPIAAKEKLVVPAYVLPDGRVRFFVINSALTDFQKARPELLKHVLPIQESLNQTFLTHDSWLCCHEIVAGYSVAQMVAANGSYRGPLDNGTLQGVMAVMKNSRLHSERDKALFLANWPT
jgi:hypothetical protein